MPLLEPIAASAAFGHAARDGRIAVPASHGQSGAAAGAAYLRLAKEVVKRERQRLKLAA